VNRRRAAAALTAALALAIATACSDDDAAVVGASTVAPGGTSSPGAPSDVPDGDDGDDAGSATTAPPGGDDASGATTPSPPTEAPPALAATGPVGSFAPGLLRPDLSSEVVVELHAAEGAAPAGATVDHVAGILEDVTGKGVSIASGGAPPGDAREWTGDQLLAEADSGSVTSQGGGVAVVRLLFVHGTFQGDDSVLGIAVRGDVAAVFVDPIRDAGGLLGGSEGIEASVTTHELGHLLGLVDVYLSTGRQDPEHPGHSANPDSVMYWAVESDLIGQLLGAHPPDRFDDADLADLAAIAGGA
jgi:hypothetical protein